MSHTLSLLISFAFLQKNIAPYYRRFTFWIHNYIVYKSRCTSLKFLMFLERWAVVLSNDVCISLDECHDFTNMRWLMFLEIRVCGFLSNVNYHYDDCTMKMWNYGYSRKQEFVLSSNCFCTFKSETKIKVYLLNPIIKMQIQN